SIQKNAWIPFTQRSLFEKTEPDGRPWLYMAGRLKPGYSRRSAASEFQLLASRLARPGMHVTLTDGSIWDDGQSFRQLFSIVLALPTMLMLMASVNVATLLLSRAVGRRQEMAIRLALGTSRFRLVRMLMIESLLLAAIAAGISLVLVY